MITIYRAETRDGWVKFSSDKDTLPPDAIRVSSHVYPDYESVLEQAEILWHRGFQVSVDTGKGLVEYEH